MDKVKRLKELTEQLNQYRDSYYNNSESLISDKQYDDLFDELQALEQETGIVMSNSPTKTVGYEVKSKLEKVKHSHPMLSLDKTKSTDDLVKFSDGRDCIISLKLDGLTVLNTYNDGTLYQSETRGNGEEGEIITHNAKVFDNLPLNIPFDRKFEIEGEAIITQSDFEKINVNGEYKNCRNLASGSVRQLDSNITKNRHIRFIAWKIPFGVTTYSQGFEIATQYGFEVVPYVKYNSKYDDIGKAIEALKNIAKEKSLPIDGLVITYNDVEYGKSLGITGHHPKHSLAFKFYDDIYPTELIDVEFTMGKTGVLTPTAVFKPVEIDGTTVEKASLHNISIMKNLKLKYGDTITVYKANQIIPQVEDNLDKDVTDSIYIIPPYICPICGGRTKIIKDNDTEVLMCTNTMCRGKLLGRLCTFVSKKGMDIDGLSEATLEKYIDLGWVNNLFDVYDLGCHYTELMNMDGFGKKSVAKLQESIEKSKDVELKKFIAALSIPGVGSSQSKELTKIFHTWDDFQNAGFGNYDFSQLEGFGNILNTNIHRWFQTMWNEDRVGQMVRNLRFKEEKIRSEDTNMVFANKIFVITGSVEHFENRAQIKEYIEERGGKVTGSVTAKTDYLINNDVQSASSKNKKAKELGVEIISEEQLLKMEGKIK